ncbi:MAG: hypothetical protein ABI703_02875, partial [Gemmatimonadales bacterium]
MSLLASSVTVRPTRPEDFAGIIELCAAVYPGAPGWSAGQLASHLKVFPEGQLLATDGPDGAVV